jgi:hypothetical protein
MFTRRLHNFKIDFKVFPFEACLLSESIRQNDLIGYGIPASIGFDRIAVSNILDANYVGLRDVLTHWAPLLAESNTAVILGYFMNWVARQEDGRAVGASSLAYQNLTKRMINKIRVTVRKAIIKRLISEK